MAENINIAGRLHSTATGNVVAGTNEIYDDIKGKKQSVVNQEIDAALDNRYPKSQTYNKTELNNMITTPNQEYETVTATDQTVDVTDVLPDPGAPNTVYRVGNWDGSQFDASVYSEYAWNGSQYIHLSTKTKIGEVFDISAYHATGGTLAKYADLAAALDSNNGGGVPQSLQEGGMSVKFVHTSNNKYIRYNLLADSFTTDITKWAVDDGGVYIKDLRFIEVKTDAQKKIIWAVKQDGSVYWGAGVPQQVIDYVQSKIEEYHVEDIVSFLNGLEEGDKTLHQLFNEKVDKEDGKSLIQEEIADNVSFKDYPEYLSVELDKNKKLLSCRDKNGVKKEYGGFETSDFAIGDFDSQQTKNTEYINILIDKNGKFIEGIDRQGRKHISELVVNNIYASNIVGNINILNGKKWAVVGDSFSASTNKKFDDGKYRGHDMTYKYLIALRNNMGIYNYTLGGRTMAYPNDHTFDNAFAKPDMYQSIPEDVNYITIMLGINDTSHLRGYSPDGESVAGAISLGTIDSVDTGTFYGAWNVVLQWLFENRPLAHIGVIVTNGLGNQGPDGGYSQYGMQIYTALKEIVKKWNVPYIDLNGDDGKTPMMQRGIYPEGTSASLIAAKWNAFAISPNPPYDGHPNYQAHEYMSYFIENFLRTL